LRLANERILELEQQIYGSKWIRYHSLIPLLILYGIGHMVS
jgi:hypothetical protein